MAYYESVGLIASLFCLPLLGFLLGRRFTVASLTGERDRQAELENIYTLIDNNRNDMADQVQSIYDAIERHHNENSQELQGVSSDVWDKLQEVDRELGLVSSARPTQPVYQPQTTTTA